ncbi:hypothetical protein RJV14_02290 [Buchnera aphidicola (Kurisakia onigurumii)]|uniref:hypothetical protein n=1 Tax=Buchnera aphidicola TaxID=9 RepID=UPI0031B69EF1
MISLEKLQKNNTSYYTDTEQDYIFNIQKSEYLTPDSEIKKNKKIITEKSTVITIIPEDKPFIYRAIRNNKFDTVEKIDKEFLIKKNKKCKKKNAINNKKSTLQEYVLINQISHNSKKNKRIHKLYSNNKYIHHKKNNLHIKHNKKNSFNNKYTNNQLNIKKNSINSKYNDFSIQEKKYESNDNHWNLPIVFNEFRKDKKINYTNNLKKFINMLEKRIILSLKIDKLKKKIKNESIYKDEKSNFLTSISISCCNLLNKIISTNHEENSKKIYPILKLLKSSLVPINILQEIKSSFDSIYTEDKKNKFHLFDQIDSVKNNKFHYKKDKRLDLRREFIKNINKNIQKYNFQKNKSNQLNKKMYWKCLDTINSSSEFFDFQKIYQKSFKKLKKTKAFKHEFLNNFNNSYYSINGKDLTSDSIPKFVKEFKNTVKDPELQQLISLYANEDVLNPAYLKLLQDNQKLLKYTPTTPNFHYKIKILDPNTIKIIAVNTGLLEKNPSSLDKNDSNTKMFCIKSVLTVSKTGTPKFHYSYAMNQ